MKKRYAWLGAILALVLLVGCAPAEATTTGQNTTAPQTTAGTQAPAVNVVPDFTVYDREGKAVKLSDFFGKPIVLNFWASWCSPCKSEMPEFNEKYLELGDQVQFLMINLTDSTYETVSSAYGYISQQGYSFPVYYDISFEAAMTYGVSSIPLTVFINADGELVDGRVGAMSGDMLQSYINKILE